MKSTRLTLGRVALAVSVAIPLAFSSAAPAQASGILNGWLCPDGVANLGTPFDSEIWDSENTTVTASISEGALPDGLRIETPTGLGGHVKGTPTKLGQFRFTMKIEDQYRHTDTRSCYMDVAPAGSRVSRIGASDRYEESVVIAQKFAILGTQPLIYLASGENYPDALSASAIAAQHDAPLLLTARDRLPGTVGSTIAAFEPGEIVVLGSTSTISESVINELYRLAPDARITRIGGADRYATSRALIAHPSLGAAGSTELFAASGRVFPDALSATPAAATIKTPVLLVDGQAMALNADEKALLTSRGVKKATVFGGSDTLSSGLEADLKAVTGTSARIEGSDRYAVSAHTVGKFFPAAKPSDTVYFATGANYPDALTGGALAGATNSPILLVSKSCVTAEVAAEVNRLNPKKIVLLGGPDTLDAGVGDLPVCK